MSQQPTRNDPFLITDPAIGELCSLGSQISQHAAALGLMHQTRSKISTVSAIACLRRSLIQADKMLECVEKAFSAGSD